MDMELGYIVLICYWYMQLSLGLPSALGSKLGLASALIEVRFRVGVTVYASETLRPTSLQ